MYFFCVVLCDVRFVTFPVLFVCICVLNNCHRVATQLQLNMSYHINKTQTLSKHCSYFISKPDDDMCTGSKHGV
jgi:hypothetical protein